MPRINHNGYIEVYSPNHHRARGNGYVFEHIIVLEEKIGRRLKENEHCHHIDGNKTNNTTDNLMVIDIKEHAKIHKKERKGAILICPNCKKEFYRKPSHIKNSKYCSVSCSVKNQKRGNRGMYI
jgi:hypothetical protein